MNANIVDLTSDNPAKALTMSALPTAEWMDGDSD
jgi:hypothetical protein